MTYRKVFLWSSFALLLCIRFGNAFELTEFGGYKIVLAVEENVPEPPDAAGIQDFIDKVTAGLRDFSRSLFFASKEKFFIESADLLLPKSWVNATTISEPAGSIHSIQSSQIRLTEAGPTNFPFVDNPNPCGLPGKFIEVPVNFFDPGNSNDGPYGNPGKALVTLWARYRYGVWEEHGYPGDLQFPYYYLNQAGVWTESSCTNAPVIGEHVKITDESTCTFTANTQPDEDCRFKPSPTENDGITSSIMSFHWLNSMTHFCDDQTHNKVAPNRQNLFCDYKSVRAVIETTEDFLTAKSAPPTGGIPILNFRTVQHKDGADDMALPPLFMLLDSGYLGPGTTEVKILQKLIIPLTIALLGDDPERLPPNVNVAVGTFPGETSGVMNTTYTFQELGSGDDPDSFRDDLLKYLPSAFKSDGKPDRDFAGALSQAIHEIEAISPENGAAIFVLKVETPANSFFDTIAYEPEIESALYRNNIKVFAIELGNPEETTTNLKALAEKTGGFHVSLDEDNQTIIDQAAIDISIAIANAIVTPSGEKKNILSVYGDVAELNIPVPVDLNRNATTVTVTLVTPYNPTAQLVISGDVETTIELADNEWDVSSRQLRVFTHAVAPGETLFQATYKCSQEESCSGDTGYLLVTETYAGSTEEIPVPEASNVKVTVASRPETAITFGEGSLPYTVNAKVELDGKRVVNAIVTATASYTNAGEPATVEFTLLDDGKGFPDTSYADGIYSANFVPPIDAEYSISITVENGPLDSANLIPIEQTEFGCVGYCNGVNFNEAVKVDTKLPIVAFTNVTGYPNRNLPEMIDDFAVGWNTDFSQMVFTFTSPFIIGGGLTEKATSYIIYASQTFDDLLPENSRGIEIENTRTVRQAGQPESFRIDRGAVAYSYYAVKAFGANNIPGKQSPIVRLGSAAGNIPPDPSSSTTTSTTTVSTTLDPSATTAPPPPASETPFHETPEGIAVITISVLLVVGAAAGGGYWYWRKRNSSRGIGYSNSF